MTRVLQPYESYKDSGMPWLVNVPAHWKVERAKWLFRKMDRPVRDTDEVITCFRDGMVTLRKNRRVRGFTEALKEIGYQGIRKGDLVIHAMDAFAGAVGVSDSDGKGTPVYSVCEPGPDANAYFFAYLIRELSRSQWILALAKGIRERSTDFRFQDFATQYFPLPPLAEQNAIVRYLDFMDRRIKRYIRAKQKLIKLLNEQKQAIIHQAVTRGLDPTVRLKPSGVEWLGDVPEHWRVSRMKRIARTNPSRSEADKAHNSDELVVFLPMERVTEDGEIDVSQLRPMHEVRHGFTYFRRGDVVIAKITPCFENGKGACLSKLPTEIGFGSTEFIVLRPNSEILAEYLYHITALTQFRRMGVESMTGSAGQQRISQDFVANFLLPLPPITEQKAILRYINNITEKFNILISHTRRDISLLREYDLRLIADVVTGKLDVRQAAARLPDETEAPELEVPLEDEEPSGNEAQEVLEEEEA